MAITTKINGVQGLTANQTVAKTKAVSIGDVCDALETIVNANMAMGAQSFARIITDKLYSSHDEAFIKMLELAGERAKTIQQDLELTAERVKTIQQDLELTAERVKTIQQDKDAIVSCGGVLSCR